MQGRWPACTDLRSSDDRTTRRSKEVPPATKAEEPGPGRRRDPRSLQALRPRDHGPCTGPGPVDRRARASRSPRRPRRCRAERPRRHPGRGRRNRRPRAAGRARPGPPNALPRRSVRRPHWRAVMTALLRAELLKLRTTRTFAAVLASAAALSLTLVVLGAVL